MDSILIVGAGVFGVTAALELRRRGYAVTLVDPGPIPHPLAPSNDVSRMVRMDYGDDELYVELCAEAIQGWHAWNRRWNEEVYHEDGILIASSQPMTPGSFEYDSFACLSQRGYDLQRINSGWLGERSSHWDSNKYVDGYFNPRAGWAEAGRAVALLAAEAKASGVEAITGVNVTGVVENGSQVTGVATAEGNRISADLVVMAAGAWTPALLPQLADVMEPVGQPIFYLKPEGPGAFQGRNFPPWAADVPRTGWYGFPANRDGIVKIANHGPGRPSRPSESRDLTLQETDRFRKFINDNLPSLAEAPIVNRRLCWYCDTWDGNFWVGHDPQRSGLVVATGGSGHAFKFAPVLGQVIADAVERVDTPYTRRFDWRPRGEAKAEALRYTGD